MPSRARHMPGLTASWVQLGCDCVLNFIFICKKQRAHPVCHHNSSCEELYFDTGGDTCDLLVSGGGDTSKQNNGQNIHKNKHLQTIQPYQTVEWLGFISEDSRILISVLV